MVGPHIDARGCRRRGRGDNAGGERGASPTPENGPTDPPPISSKPLEKGQNSLENGNRKMLNPSRVGASRRGSQCRGGTGPQANQ